MAAAKRSSAASVASRRVSRILAHAMESCSRGREPTNCGGSFSTMPRNVVMRDWLIKALVCTCSTRSTARVASPAASAWSTASLK